MTGMAAILFAGLDDRLKMKLMSSRVFVAGLLLTLAGCGGSQEVSEAGVDDNAPAVEAYYRDNPERFVFSTIDQLPPDLTWENGEGLAPIGDPRARRGGQLRLRVNSMQQTLRILGPDANSTLRGPLWNANMIYLLMRHPWEDAYMPGLARAWAIDPEDSRTIYLRLDPDARWSDGRPFTTEDIFFSLYFLLSPDIQDPAVNRVFDENVTRITRYDDSTVAFTFTKPTPDPLGNLSTFILVQREFYREFGEDYVDRYHWRFSPVTGPYTLADEDIRKGRQVTFRRLENWWADDKPYYRHRFNPERLTFLLIRDDNKAFEAFLRGDIDWHAMNRTTYWHERAEEQPIVDGYIERAWVYDQLPAARIGVYMNSEKPRLNDRTLRLGIQHAINYDRVNERLYRGDRHRIRSFADGYGRYSHPTLAARSFDLEKAAEYFTEAGFGQRGDDGILVNAADERLSFVLTVPNRGDEVTVAALLKEEALRAGLELQLDVMDPTAYFTKVFEKNFQLSLHSWNTGYSPLPAFEWELRGVDAGKPQNFNTTNINDPRLDELLAAWDKNADPDIAEKLSHEAQQRIHDYAAWVPGLMADFHRMGYWRWVQFPDYFQVPRYFFFLESGVFWIDEERRAETMRAREEGERFPPVTDFYERWRRE